MKRALLVIVAGCTMILSGCSMTTSESASNNVVNQTAAVNTVTNTPNGNMSNNGSNQTANKSTNTTTAEQSTMQNTTKVSTPVKPKPPVQKVNQPKTAAMGQKVQIGFYSIVFPATIKTPMITTTNQNLQEFNGNGPSLFIEVDVTNTSNEPRFLGTEMFNLTWTPQGGLTSFYLPDKTEEYNIDTDTYQNGTYYYGLPYSHLIQPGATERLDLVYDVPLDMNANQVGVIGVEFQSPYGGKQFFSLSQLN